MPFYVQGDADLARRMARLCASREASSPIAQLDSQASIWASDSAPPAPGIYRAWVRNAKADYAKERRRAERDIEAFDLEALVVHGIPIMNGALSQHLVLSRSATVCVAHEREAWLVLLDALDTAGVVG